MQTWKMLLITLLAAVVIGSLAGILLGKYLVKRSRPDHKALLSNKERIIYSACILLGAACILFGVFYRSGGGEMGMVGEDGMMMGEEMWDEDAQAAMGELDDMPNPDAEFDGEDDGDTDSGEPGGDADEDDPDADAPEDGEPDEEDDTDEPAPAAAAQPSANPSAGGSGVIVYDEAVAVAVPG